MPENGGRDAGLLSDCSSFWVGMESREQACHLYRAEGRMDPSEAPISRVETGTKWRITLVHRCRQGTFRPALAKGMPETFVRVPQHNQEEWWCILSGPGVGSGGDSGLGRWSQSSATGTCAHWVRGGLRRACLADGRRRLGG